MTLEFVFKTMNDVKILAELEIARVDASFDHAFGREVRYEPRVIWDQSRFYVEHRGKRRQIQRVPASEIDRFMEVMEEKWLRHE